MSVRIGSNSKKEKSSIGRVSHLLRGVFIHLGVQFTSFPISLYSSTVEHNTVNIMIDVRFILGAFK